MSPRMASTLVSRNFLQKLTGTEVKSCTYNNPPPNPPTSQAACAVPMGGSNQTIIDTCCNGHINPIVNYGAPGEADCWQYCTTDDPNTVQSCLEQNMGIYNPSNPRFACYNAVSSKNTTSMAAVAALSKPMILVMALGLLGTIMCGL
jgi:hypothetical protein